VKVARLTTGNYEPLLATVIRDLGLVLHYADRWRRGERWEPISITSRGLSPDNAELFAINDGYHRLAAALFLGLEDIEVDMRCS
jgi:hypothetical protein